MPEVHVCHAGTCRAAGAEGVLLEIEELASAVGEACKVRESGCLGYCNQAPNVLINRRTIQTRVTSLEKSAAAVAKATGARPDLSDPAVEARLAGLREARARAHAVSVYKWNAALRGRVPRDERVALLAKAGFDNTSWPGTTTPTAIANYTKWSLESATAVSRHSALFRFRSRDLKRGTPHPRGRGRVPNPITWHTTMLAEVGATDEGPLPWVERDYTPVSTAHDWEQGRLDLLVKVYADGVATSWLQAQTPGASEVWFSQPVKTLGVPGLVADGVGFRPKSVLLVLAGTGVVALPQILCHRDPGQMLRISTPKRDQLKVPIDCVYSCREDDPLLLRDVAGHCAAGGDATGVRHLTLLLTPPATSDKAPFPDFEGDATLADALFAGLGNATVRRKRVDASDLAAAYHGLLSKRLAPVFASG